MDNEQVEDIELTNEEVVETENEDSNFIEIDDEDILVDENEDADSNSSEELGEGSQEGLCWYIVQCYALYEQKVRDRILQMQENEFKDIVFRVLLPEEETVEIKNNERKEKIKKMFPGYLFVQMKPDEGAWYLLRRLPGVAKLVGTKNEPTPVSEEEINRILRQLGEKMKKIEVDFELNEVIKVISGPFRGYTGSISEINPERGKLKSLISIFGRETPVELDFDQVEKYVDNK
ncbi:MAG: transcription termination/antitermination protein NusG [Candidatus Margulisiibacteriota bacterium]